MSNTAPTRAAELAAQFRANAARVEFLTAEVELSIPSIAPDFKFKFVARRIDILTLLHGGVLPEALAQQLLESRERGGEEFAETLTGEETLQLLRFQQHVARQVCVAPKLVFHPAGEGEIDLREVPFAGELITALFKYAMALSPDVPVATTEGETDVQAVANFREKPAHVDAGGDGRKVRRTPQRVA